jgi:two-component system phosphate regulon sensor histidine kinase PhoR
MNLRRKIWLCLFLPADTVGIVTAAIAAWQSRGGASPAQCLGAALSTASGINILLWRRIRTIRDQLRLGIEKGHQSDVLRTASSALGPFRDVLGDTIGLLRQARTETEQASLARTEVEARYNVRNKQARRLEAVFHALPDAVLVIDNLGNVSFWNRGANRLFRSLSGVSHGDSSVLAEPPDVSLFPGLRDMISTTRSRGPATPPRIRDFDVVVADVARFFQVTVSKVQDEDNLPQGIMVVLRDVAHEPEVKSRHAEFLSSATHELKTPLSGIRAFLEMLIDGDVEDRDEQLKLFGFMDVQIDRLTRLINNMLNLARIESGVIKVQREDCGLNEVLEKALDVVRPLAAEKNITLEPQLSDLYLPVHIDRDLFGQATINLLSNAIKYTPEGGTVRLRSRNVDGEAALEVRDTGMGIPEADLGRIFERFYRVAQNNKAAAGTGLGLALVHYIVTQIHSGRIHVESKVDEGSCFTVSIPLGHRHSSRRKATEASLCTVGT